MNKIVPASDFLKRNRYERATKNFPRIFRGGDIHFKLFCARYSHLIRSFNHPPRLIRGSDQWRRISFYIADIFFQSASNLASFVDTHSNSKASRFRWVQVYWANKVSVLAVFISWSLELQKFYVETTETTCETWYSILHYSLSRRWTLQLHGLEVDIYENRPRLISNANDFLVQYIFDAIILGI